MPDTAAIADEIRRLITAGASQTELIAVVAHVAKSVPRHNHSRPVGGHAGGDGRGGATGDAAALRIFPHRIGKASCACSRTAEAIHRPGRAPPEITCGDLFRVEVDGAKELRLTRMEHLYAEEYFSIDGYSLRDGIRAAIGSRE